MCKERHETYRRALAEIKRRISKGLDPTKAASAVVTEFGICDEAMSESLHEESCEYAHDQTDSVQS